MQVKVKYMIPNLARYSEKEDFCFWKFQTSKKFWPLHAGGGLEL